MTGINQNYIRERLARIQTEIDNRRNFATSLRGYPQRASEGLMHEEGGGNAAGNNSDATIEQNHIIGNQPSGVQAVNEESAIEYSLSVYSRNSSTATLVSDSIRRGRSIHNNRPASISSILGSYTRSGESDSILNDISEISMNDEFALILEDIRRTPISGEPTFIPEVRGRRRSANKKSIGHEQNPRLRVRGHSSVTGHYFRAKCIEWFRRRFRH